jgi:hypothetical protein
MLRQRHVPSRSGAICHYADASAERKLMLMDAMTEFDASNRNCRIGKRLEAFH